MAKRLLGITAGLALLQGLRLGGLWLLVYGPGLLSLACGALFTPLFEELLFRGWVWRGLERHGLRPGLRRGPV